MATKLVRTFESGLGESELVGPCRIVSTGKEVLSRRRVGRQRLEFWESKSSSPGTEETRPAISLEICGSRSAGIGGVDKIPIILGIDANERTWPGNTRRSTSVRRTWVVTFVLKHGAQISDLAHIDDLASLLKSKGAFRLSCIGSSVEPERDGLAGQAPAKLPWR